MSDMTGFKNLTDAKEHQRLQFAILYHTKKHKKIFSLIIDYINIILFRHEQAIIQENQHTFNHFMIFHEFAAIFSFLIRQILVADDRINIDGICRVLAQENSETSSGQDTIEQQSYG